MSIADCILRAHTAHRSAIESLYQDRCTIIERQNVKDEETGITSLKEVISVKNQPCRISFDTFQPAEGENAQERTQKITLFIAPEIEIKAGSKIEITRCGKATAYSTSGQPAVYDTHQEIELTLFDRWC